MRLPQRIKMYLGFFATTAFGWIVLSPIVATLSLHMQALCWAHSLHFRLTIRTGQFLMMETKKISDEEILQEYTDQTQPPTVN